MNNLEQVMVSMDDSEIWEDINIPEVEPRYMISNYGRVYNKNTKRYLTVTLEKTGRLSIGLCIIGKKGTKRFVIADLIARAFIPHDTIEYSRVSYKDGLVGNLALDNLEWVTQMYPNVYDSCLPDNGLDYAMTSILDGEIWVDICLPKVQPWYMVSNHGRVYSKLNNIIMNDRHQNAGYRVMTLRTTNKKATDILVHRLVALFHVPNTKPEVFIQVNHKDGIKYNNAASNLEWVSQNYNMKHAYNNDLRVQGENHNLSTIPDTQIHTICKAIQDGYDNEDIRELLGVECDSKITHTINSIRAGRNRKAISGQYGIVPAPAYVPKDKRINQ